MLHKATIMAAVAVTALSAIALFRASAADTAGLSGSTVAGAEVRLAPGYQPQLRIVNKHYSPAITINAVENVFDTILIRGSTGIHIFGGHINAITPKSVVIDSSSDILLAGMSVSGQAPEAGPRNEVSKIFEIKRSSNISLSQNRIHKVAMIASIHDSDGVTIADNSFSDAREGLMVLSSRGLTVERNLFARWKPRFDRGEHPDMIQFFTRGRQTPSAHVRIEKNAFLSGDRRKVQGIFIRSEDRESGRSPDATHRDFTIKDNVYHGSSFHAISLASVHDFIIENNTILSSPNALRRPVYRDPTGDHVTGDTPVIYVSSNTKGRVAYNVTPGVKQKDPSTVVDLSANLITPSRRLQDLANPGGCFPELGSEEFPPPLSYRVLASCKKRGHRLGAAIMDWGAPEAFSKQRALATHRISADNLARMAMTSAKQNDVDH